MDLLLCIPVAQRCIKIKDFILVFQDEKRCFGICDQVYSVLESES